MAAGHREARGNDGGDHELRNGSARIAGALLAIAAFGCGPWTADRAAAQSYPNRPIKLVVPLVPGSPGDIVARLVADKLSVSLKQPFVVENRPGAAGNIGTELIARVGARRIYARDGARHDAHGESQPLQEAAVRPGQGFPADLDSVDHVGQMLVVHPSVPVNSVEEFVAFAKAATARKEPITYASGGIGIPGHLAMENFRVRAGFDAIHVPYRGNAPMVVDLVAGQVKFAFVTSAGMMDHVQAGRLKGLGVSRTSRSPLAPDVPTIAELGYPGFAVENLQRDAGAGRNSRADRGAAGARGGGRAQASRCHRALAHHGHGSRSESSAPRCWRGSKPTARNGRKSSRRPTCASNDGAHVSEPAASHREIRRK